MIARTGMAKPAIWGHDGGARSASHPWICKAAHAGRTRGVGKIEDLVSHGSTAGHERRGSVDAAELRTTVAAVNRMVCDGCGTVYFSAAARTMVERGERCAKCGGALKLVDAPRPVAARGEPRNPPPERDDAA